MGGGRWYAYGLRLELSSKLQAESEVADTNQQPTPDGAPSRAQNGSKVRHRSGCINSIASNYFCVCRTSRKVSSPLNLACPILPRLARDDLEKVTAVLARQKLFQ